MVCHYVCEKNIERNFMMIRREPGSESRFASETSNYRIRYYCTPKTVGRCKYRDCYTSIIM